MTIDKSWIKLRYRSSTAFLKGLRNFMDIAKNHVNSQGKAPCPCIKCVNRKGQKLETIYAHIHDWGFLKVYETWVHHGERFANEAKVAAIFSKKPRIEEETGEMFDVLDDVRGEQNIVSTEDVEAAYRQPPRDYDLDKWHSLIDNLFLKDEHVKRCQVNAMNRAKQPYSSLHGSQSYANIRHIEIDETGSSSYIDNWNRMHSRGGIFLNRAAEETFEKIEQQKETLGCEVGDESTSIDEAEALRRALGTRRGHTRGIGRKLKHVTPTVSSSNYLPQGARDERIQELEQTVQQSHSQLEQQMREMRAFIEQQMGGVSKTGKGRNTNQDFQNDEDEDDD